VCTQLIQTLKERESFVQTTAMQDITNLSNSYVQQPQSNAKANELEKKYRVAESQRIVIGEIRSADISHESPLYARIDL
jgi:hypothetical protein